MTASDNWHIFEPAFPIKKVHHKETVFTIGNGYLASRGSFEEGYPGEIATTFVHGVFNDVPTFGTELVNFPNPFSLTIFLGDEIFRLDQGKILAYQRTLSLESGLLTRSITWESPGGKRATIVFDRFMDMMAIHHAALRFSIEDISFSGKVQIRAGLQGVVSNENYRHWDHEDQGRFGVDGCYLALNTPESRILAGMAESVDLDFNGEMQLDYWDSKWCPSLVFTCQVRPEDEILGEKHVTIYTSREEPDPIQKACQAVVEHAKVGFDSSLKASNEIWEDLWSRSNVIIEGDDLADRALRYNLFQILVAAPRHDETVSIGAKTLSGYGYRGHVFWDTEIFILPFLVFTQPSIARNLLMYRYHTLAGAREKAQENGYQGAMYAWESAGTGKEVTPRWVVGPEGNLIKIWCGEIEQHITADIVYGIHLYCQATGDDDFMRDYGAEIVLSAGQFYASRLSWESGNSAYHMRDVIGPDEYHEHVDDNAMTNLMAAWTLKYAGKVAGWMGQNWPEAYKDLLGKLALTQDEIVGWEEMREKVAIHKRKDGVIEQFEGYFDLIYLDQLKLEPRDQSMQSLFGIEGVQQYQFIKQPDVVMAQYLLRDQFTQGQIMANMAYYSSRTDLSHGSSLGSSIQALMLARMGEAASAKALFIKTLLTDLENNRGNTPDGIHAASAGAVWQVLVMGFAGMDIQNGKPQFDVTLPKAWKKVRFKLCWRDQRLVFDNF